MNKYHLLGTCCLCLSLSTAYAQAPQDRPVSEQTVESVLVVPKPLCSTVQTEQGFLIAVHDFSQDESQIYIHNASTGDINAKIDFGKQAIYQLQFTPKGDFLLIFTEKRIHYIDTKKGVETRYIDLPANNSPESVEISPDGSHMLLVCTTPTEAAKAGSPPPPNKAVVRVVKLDDLSFAFTMDLELDPSNERVPIVKFAPNTTKELIYAQGKSLNAIDCVKKTVGHIATLDKEIWSIKYSPDGRVLFIGGSDGYLGSLSPLGIKTHHAGTEGEVEQIQISENGSMILGSVLYGGLCLYNWVDDKLYNNINKGVESQSACSISPDGKYLAAVSYDNKKIIIIDIAKESIITELEDEGISLVFFDEKGTKVYYLTSGGEKVKTVSIKQA